MWTGAGTGDDGSIQAQRYDAAGAPLGTQFQVNSYTTGNQFHPAVAMDSLGNFVVVWRSDASAGPDTFVSIQGQRYDATGAAVGSEFQVNSYSTGLQELPAIASDSAGNFVVVWFSNPDIRGQRYDADGMPLGGEFQVNTATSGYPAIAADPAGDFVVVWQDGVDVHGRLYDDMGTPVGGEFQVNTYTYRLQGSLYGAQAVAMDAAGNFVVAWQAVGSVGTDASSRSIQARRYDATGTALGTQFQVNSYTSFDQTRAGVSSDAAGNFVVTWESIDDETRPSIQGQRFSATGAPQGRQFEVNRVLSSSLFPQPSFPAVAAVDDGRFVVAWADGATYAQRFLPEGSLPGLVTTVKGGALAKFVAKRAPGDTFTLPAADPVVSGATLRFFDTGLTAGDDTYALPPGSAWTGLGNPPGLKGYKYAGAGTAGDPCKVVLVKASVIKGICKGTGVALVPPFAGDVGVILSVGTNDRYCAQFGGDTVKSDTTIERRKGAPAPAACP